MRATLMRDFSPLRFVQKFQGLISVALLLLAALIIPSSRDAFYQSATVGTVAADVAVYGALAVGMTFVILTGGIDLSVGSMCAVVSVVAAKLALTGHSLAFVVPVCILLGAGLGLINGLLVAYTRLQPFVVTLAAMASLRGAAYLYTNNSNVSGFPRIFEPLEAQIGPAPVKAVLLIAMVIVGWVLLKKTVPGRYIYAIGGNEEAARASGVPVQRIKAFAYTLNGACVAIAALLLTARANNGEPGGAFGYELDAIAAVVVGGASLMGGTGSVFGSFTGALFIQMLSMLMILWSIPDKLAMGLKGPIILIAVYLQSVGRK